MIGLVEQLKVTRKDKNLSIRKVAELIGCDPSSVLRWERGDAEPTAEHYENIKNWLNSIAIMQKSIASMQLPRTTHPAYDPNFMVAVKLFEACSISKGGTCECPVKHECMRLYNTLTEKCSDKILTSSDLIEYLYKFILLWNAAKK